MLNEYLLSFLFGSIRYTTPAVLLTLAWFLIKDIEYNYRPTHLIGAFLFFISLSGIMHLHFPVELMWLQALGGHGGGVFGMSAWVLKSYLGSIASWVILLGLAIVSILLIFNTSITAFILIHKKIFEHFGKLGLAIVESVKFLFVKKHREPVFVAEESYEEDSEDSQEDGPDEKQKRRFFKRRLNQNHEEDETEETDEDEAEEDVQTENRAADAKVKPESERDEIWSKNVLIRPLPNLSLLSTKRGKPTSGDIQANAGIIQGTLKEFGIEVEMQDVRVGPTVTQYALKPAKGVKLSRLTSLHNDLALALAAHPIRIEAPIPGKSLVGIEVPNEKTALVSFRELLESESFRLREHDMMVALGKDVTGKVWFADLPRMPHLLIAGATGSGKTVCVNTIIMSLLFQNTAETLRIIMVDPKRVELTLYNGVPHLLTPVITNVHKTVNALKWTIGEMERRFEALASVRTRDIASYNKKYPRNKMPHIVFIIDELADLMASAGNEVEAGIIRLAQMARAVGIHLILATQRPSVDVITGLMKANIPARIAFSVASLIDSRTILDCPGAEKLLGRGDMLFQTAELSKPVRIQGSFISEDELKDVVEYLKGDEEPEYDESIIEKQSDRGTMNLFGGPSDDLDPLFLEAKNHILESGKASASFLQRRLKIGYARAARILDELEEAGIIGPVQGAKPREILMTEKIISATMGAGAEHNVFKTRNERLQKEPSEYDEDEYQDEQDKQKEYPEDEMPEAEETEEKKNHDKNNERNQDENAEDNFHSEGQEN